MNFNTLLATMGSSVSLPVLTQGFIPANTRMSSIQPSLPSQFTSKINRPYQSLHTPSAKPDSLRPQLHQLQMKQGPGVNHPDIAGIRQPYGHSDLGLKVRDGIKKGLYTAMGIASAVDVAKGVQQPLVQFHVKSDPPSMFYNFPIDTDQLPALKKYIGLPEDWDLLPVSCVEGQDPAYMMSLNVYEVGGITEGLRAEWSVYVDRGDGEPSFFVFKTHVDQHSMDPENIITMPAKNFKHEVKDGVVHTEIKGRDGDYFSIKTPMHSDDQHEVKSDRQWLAANDYIFWPGGICDMAYFSGDVFNAPLHDHSSPETECKNKAPHAQFLKKEAPTVLSLSKAGTFIVSPWANVSPLPKDKS